MTDRIEELNARYPKEVSLGTSTVTFRLMTAPDRDAILSFARTLPPDDLLFLRLDIATPEGIDEWIRNLEAGRTITVLAEAGAAIAGYASVHNNQALWNRHVGEIRVIVGSDYRRHGLGRRLTDEVFAIARELGLRKITAQMTPDQKGARATFERLGFRPEALLADYVVDRDGKTRDLLIMSHDVSGFTDVEHVGVAASAPSA
ncbi:MAG: GNAT family N-acetyltransferase [Dehalococcoidia bacterium]|nr:GNAT family N-acetyltransferase [Dehalococcoidia bacterium]